MKAQLVVGVLYYKESRAERSVSSRRQSIAYATFDELWKAFMEQLDYFHWNMRDDLNRANNLVACFSMQFVDDIQARACKQRDAHLHMMKASSAHGYSAIFRIWIECIHFYARQGLRAKLEVGIWICKVRKQWV